RIAMASVGPCRWPAFSPAEESDARSLRGRSRPGCGIAALIVYAVRMFDAFWPVEPLRAGKPSKIRTRAATFSLRLLLPRRLLGACAAEAICFWSARLSPA